MDVKGVRIGMDGQKPPTTRIVVDLEHACRYDLNPSSDGKLVLTLHTQAHGSASASVPKSTAEARLSARQQDACLRLPVRESWK
jgi:hypothetical protein